MKTDNFFIFFPLDKGLETGYNENMENKLIITPVAHIRSDFKDKFGIPRQSGRAPSLTAEIIFLPEYRNPDAIKELDGFSHIWLLFDFSKSHRKSWAATVRPPRLGGNKRVGVFASRSPFRPNPIGLSCVKLERIEKREKEGNVLIVSGADLLDGTPILDVKPYLPFADCIPTATAGYAALGEEHRLNVVCPQALLEELPKDKQEGLMQCLADDPRPSYQDDDLKRYGMQFAGFEIGFTVQENTLTVVNINKI